MCAYFARFSHLNSLLFHSTPDRSIVWFSRTGKRRSSPEDYFSPWQKLVVRARSTRPDAARILLRPSRRESVCGCVKSPFEPSSVADSKNHNKPVPEFNICNRRIHASHRYLHTRAGLRSGCRRRRKRERALRVNKRTQSLHRSAEIYWKKAKYFLRLRNKNKLIQLCSEGQCWCSIPASRSRDSAALGPSKHFIAFRRRPPEWAASFICIYALALIARASDRWADKRLEHAKEVRARAGNATAEEE